MAPALLQVRRPTLALTLSLAQTLVLALTLTLTNPNPSLNPYPNPTPNPNPSPHPSQAPDIDVSRLTPRQVSTIEDQFELRSDGSPKEREERAAAFLKDERAMLKKEKHGDVSDDAVDRVKMQLACATLANLQEVGDMTGVEWCTNWRELKKEKLDAEFASAEDGIGWLVGALQCETRRAAIGTSAGGARAATRSGQELHKQQGINEALAALKAADAQFAEWYATAMPHHTHFSTTTVAQRPHSRHALTSAAHAQDGPRARACAHLGRGREPRTRMGWAAGGRDAVAARALCRLLLRRAALPRLALRRLPNLCAERRARMVRAEAGS